MNDIYILFFSTSVMFLQLLVLCTLISLSIIVFRLVDYFNLENNSYVPDKNNNSDEIEKIINIHIIMVE
jgi:hypothetical protein